MTSHTRRLPVYLVIDCSESMAGPAFAAVQSGIQTLLNELRSDPQVLETVWVSVITFSGRARVVTPLTDLCQFTAPKLVLGSGTSLGVSLDFLEQRMSAEVILQTASKKGDWKPVVFLMTDGDPTDTWFKSADRFLATISGKKANVIAVACGPNVTFSNLRRITPNVVAFKDPASPSFKDFFKWVSQSVQTTSVRVAQGGRDGVELPSLPPSMEMAVEGLQLPSQQGLFLLCRCSGTKSLYVSRFERLSEEVLNELRRRRGVHIPIGKEIFSGTGAHPVADFDWETASGSMNPTVASDSLVAPPPCPYCAAKYWASCGACARICCIAGDGLLQCPWCGVQATYGEVTEAFQVGRSMG